MEIILTYRGKIQASKDREAVWTLREAFSAQLAKLYGKPPFEVLKRWEDTGFEASAPKFTRYWKEHTFVPLHGRDIGVGVDIDITLLTGVPERSPVLHAGDLDNRVKRLIDALRVPKGADEMRKTMGPPGRWYSLVEDDDAVLGVKASLGTYLASDDPADSFAFIRVRPVATRVVLSNLEMLF